MRGAGALHTCTCSPARLLHGAGVGRERTEGSGDCGCERCAVRRSGGARAVGPHHAAELLEALGGVGDTGREGEEGPMVGG